MPTKSDLFFFFPSPSPTTPFIHTRMHVHTCTYTQVGNRQRSIGRLNSSSACYCFNLTSTFQLLLEMFHENNSVSQGCNAHFVFVLGLVRIAIFTPSEAVSSFKLSPADAAGRKTSLPAALSGFCKGKRWWDGLNSSLCWLGWGWDCCAGHLACSSKKFLNILKRL